MFKNIIKYFDISLIFILILLVPFSNLLHTISPKFIFEKSAWVVSPVILLLFIFTFQVFKANKILTKYFIFLILIAASYIIFLFRDYYYTESRSYFDFRYIATSILYLFLSQKTIYNQTRIKILCIAIILQGFLVSTLLHVNFNFLSYVVMIDNSGDSIISEGDKTRSMLLGASIASGLIICSMFLLFVVKKYKIFKIKSLPFFLMQLYLFISVLYPESRWPIFLSFLILISSILIIKNGFKIIITICFILITYLILFNHIEKFIYVFNNTRFGEDSGGRLEKFILPFRLYSASFTNFMLGPSSRIVDSAQLNGEIISDNSYHLVGLQFGIPFALLYFSFILHLLYKNNYSYISKLFTLYFLITFGLTNSILWEPWVMTSIFTLILLNKIVINNKIKNEQSQNFNCRRIPKV
jgi:hypothetical protein